MIWDKTGYSLCVFCFDFATVCYPLGAPWNKTLSQSKLEKGERFNDDCGGRRLIDVRDKICASGFLCAADIIPLFRHRISDSEMPTGMQLHKDLVPQRSPTAPHTTLNVNT